MPRRTARCRAATTRRSHRFLRQLRHRFADPLDPLVVDDERRQVRIGKIAVVLRVFLAAHRARLATVGIVEARLLHDGAAVLDQLDLAAHLEVDRLLHEAEAVEVLDLAARAELVAPGRRTDTLASQRKLPSCMLPSQMPIQRTSAVQRLRVGDRLVGAAHVRLGHDLEQRRAGAIEIDAGHAVKVLVQALARVFLEMRARETHGLLAAGDGDSDRRRPARRGSRTARSGSPSADPGRNNSCARTRCAG